MDFLSFFREEVSNDASSPTNIQDDPLAVFPCSRLDGFKIEFWFARGFCQRMVNPGKFIKSSAVVHAWWDGSVINRFFSLHQNVYKEYLIFITSER